MIKKCFYCESENLFNISVLWIISTLQNWEILLIVKYIKDWEVVITNLPLDTIDLLI